jgi:hypothetical protein
VGVLSSAAAARVSCSGPPTNIGVTPTAQHTYKSREVPATLRVGRHPSPRAFWNNHRRRDLIAINCGWRWLGRRRGDSHNF